jgi:hypothetical protein
MSHADALAVSGSNVAMFAPEKYCMLFWVQCSMFAPEKCVSMQREPWSAKACRSKVFMPLLLLRISRCLLPRKVDAGHWSVDATHEMNACAEGRSRESCFVHWAWAMEVILHMAAAALGLSNVSHGGNPAHGCGSWSMQSMQRWRCGSPPRWKLVAAAAAGCLAVRSADAYTGVIVLRASLGERKLARN